MLERGTSRWSDDPKDAVSAQPPFLQTRQTLSHIAIDMSLVCRLSCSIEA